MKSVFFIVFILFSSALVAEEYWVIKVEGNPSVHIKELKKQVPITLGDFIKSNWTLMSNKPARINVRCIDGEIAVIGRNQTPKQMCDRSKTINSGEITRYRNDDDKRFPVLLRPRSENLVNLFPIKWRYSANSEVDVIIHDIDTGERRTLRYQSGDVLTQESSDYVVNGGGNYKIVVCRSGTLKVCSNQLLDLNYRVVTDKDKHQLAEQTNNVFNNSSLKSDGHAYAAVLYLNGYFDDALDTLEAEFLFGKFWGQYIAAQSYKNTGLFEKAEVQFQALIDNYLVSRQPGSELIAISSCYSLQDLYQYFEGGYGQADFLKKKYTSICTVY